MRRRRAQWYASDAQRFGGTAAWCASAAAVATSHRREVLGELRLVALQAGDEVGCASADIGNGSDATIISFRGTASLRSERQHVIRLRQLLRGQAPLDLALVAGDQISHGRIIRKSPIFHPNNKTNSWIVRSIRTGPQAAMLGLGAGQCGNFPAPGSSADFPNNQLCAGFCWLGLIPASIREVIFLT